MRKLLAAVLFALLLTVAVSPPASAQPETRDFAQVTEIAAAHPRPSGLPSAYDWCIWTRAALGQYPYFAYVASRWIHYGDAHVYQCELERYGDGWNTCYQQVYYGGWQQLTIYLASPQWDNAGNACWEG